MSIKCKNKPTKIIMNILLKNLNNKGKNRIVKEIKEF